MLALTFIAPLLVLVTPLASGMPHSLASLVPLIDERAGDWKLAAVNGALDSASSFVVANATLVARDIGTPRVLPLNPKNPNFSQSVSSLQAAKTTTTVQPDRSSVAPRTTTTTKATTTIKKTTTTSTTKTTTTTKKTTTLAALSTVKATTLSVGPATASPAQSSAASSSSTTPVVSSTTTTTAAPSVHTGQATYFFQDGQPGACGNYNPDSLPLVALRASLYGDTSKVSKYCGRYVAITNTASGKSVVAIVADACPGCATYYSLDLSTGAFDQIGNRDTGILPISWYFLPIGYSPSSAEPSVATTTTTNSSPSSSATTSSPASSGTAAPQTFTGQGTFFFQGGQAGACGVYNADTVPLVALDYRLYGNINAVSKYCGKYVTITNTANGKSVVAKVQDACPTCASKYSLDLSTGAYDQIGDRDTGILSLSWHFNN